MRGDGSQIWPVAPLPLESPHPIEKGAAALVGNANPNPIILAMKSIGFIEFFVLLARGSNATQFSRGLLVLKTETKNTN